MDTDCGRNFLEDALPENWTTVEALTAFVAELTTIPTQVIGRDAAVYPLQERLVAFIERYGLRENEPRAECAECSGSCPECK